MPMCRPLFSQIVYILLIKNVKSFCRDIIAVLSWKKKKYLPAFDLYISYRLAHCVIFFILSL